MKFLVITDNGSYILEDEEDFSSAADHAWDDHSGHDHVNAIVKLPD